MGNAFPKLKIIRTTIVNTFSASILLGSILIILLNGWLIRRDVKRGRQLTTKLDNIKAWAARDKVLWDQWCDAFERDDLDECASVQKLMLDNHRHLSMP